MSDQTIISDDIYIRLGRSGYLYISSVSQESMVPIAPSEVPVLSAFLISYLAAPSNIGFQRTGQAAPSTVLDGFMEQQGETARR